MKKRLKRLFNKKGITLVELLVVLVVSSILLTIAFNMLQVTNGLMTSIKSNANLDTTCDAANEYIRSSLQNAISISVYTYPDGATSTDATAMNNQYDKYHKDYIEGATGAYKINALAVLRNYNDDYRLYDFGDISDFNNEKFKWGTSFHVQKFNLLIDNRDGGGKAAGGLDFNEFHRFDAFNDAFYSSGGTSGELNYSFQLCFDSEGKKLKDEDGVVKPDVYGVNYLTFKSQIFKRTGKTVFDHWGADGSPVFSSMASFEPVNQLRTISFKLFNGSAEFPGIGETEDGAIKKVINKTKIESGAEIIDTSSGMSGVILLYVTRNL